MARPIALLLAFAALPVIAADQDAVAAFACDFGADGAYGFTVPPDYVHPAEDNERAVGYGTYRNLKRQSGGDTILVRQGAMLTIVEFDASDNALIVNIWLDRADVAGTMPGTLVVAGPPDSPKEYGANIVHSGKCRSRAETTASASSG